MRFFRGFSRTGMLWAPPARKNLFPRMLLLSIFCLGVLALIIGNFRGDSTDHAQIPVQPLENGLQYLLEAANWHNRSFEGIIKAAIPLTNTGSDYKPNHFKAAAQMLVSFASGAQIGRPVSFLQAQIPLMQGFNLYPQQSNKDSPTKKNTTQQRPGQASGDKSEPDPKADVNTKPVPLSDKPLVAVYNTHTGETYEKTDGLDRLAGKRGGVYYAAEAMAKALESRYGIKVVQSGTIHDDNFLLDNPYAKSATTLSAILKENSSLKMVIDVHRDAGVSREHCVMEIDGKKVAKVMLVVGTNARQNHPNWQKNYAFAQEFGKKINERYPGLLRKIITKRGRYNQQMHPNAVLLEIGSNSNSTEEAINTANLLADVVAEMVKNSGKSKPAENNNQSENR